MVAEGTVEGEWSVGHGEMGVADGVLKTWRRVRGSCGVCVCRMLELSEGEQNAASKVNSIGSCEQPSREESECHASKKMVRALCMCK